MIFPIPILAATRKCSWAAQRSFNSTLRHLAIDSGIGIMRGLRPDPQSGFYGEGLLAGVEGEKVVGAECDGGCDMQHVEATAAECFRMRRAECLCLGVNFRP